MERETKKLPPLKLPGDENNNIYDGHWKICEEKVERPLGKGIKFKEDGEVMEGYFDCADREFVGRIIKPNGEVYIGHVTN